MQTDSEIERTFYSVGLKYQTHQTAERSDCDDLSVGEDDQQGINNF